MAYRQFEELYNQVLFIIYENGVLVLSAQATSYVCFLQAYMHKNRGDVRDGLNLLLFSSI